MAFRASPPAALRCFFRADFIGLIYFAWLRPHRELWDGLSARDRRQEDRYAMAQITGMLIVAGALLGFAVMLPAFLLAEALGGGPIGFVLEALGEYVALLPIVSGLVWGVAAMESERLQPGYLARSSRPPKATIVQLVSLGLTAGVVGVLTLVT